MAIRLMIFEDNQFVRNALQTIFAEDPELICCGAYESGNRWMQEIEFYKPDIVLMDIEMPGLSGLELTQHITTQFPKMSSDTNSFFRQ